MATSSTANSSAPKKFASRRLLFLGNVLPFLLLACAPGEAKSGLGPAEPSPIIAITVAPDTANLATGGTVTFSASATHQDGSSSDPQLTWLATGGSVSSAGVYTAGNSVGTYRVVAVEESGTVADTSVVLVTASPPTLQAVILAPSTVSLASGATQQFSVTGQWSNGSSTAPAVTYSATGGTINTNGRYTAGTTAGTFRVIATQQGGTLADTAAVTVMAAPPVLQAVILTPASVSLATGAQQNFTVSGQWSDGSTAAPAVTYTATGGTINTNGRYTAGTTAGTFRVIATQQGGTLADTAAVTITATPPVLQAVILNPASASLTFGGTQQFSVTGQWSNGATTPPAVTYSAKGGSITTGGLYTAGSTAGTFRVIATQQGGSLADTSIVTIVGGGGGTALFSEGFENGDLGSRGWFDVTTVATVADARPGSPGTRSLEWHWTPGMVAPQTASRFDFAPTASVYLSYWVKQSSNWIGSGRAYHPHMFQVLTTADDHWIGPSRTHLTVYSELLYKAGLGGSRVNMAAQDALNIDTNNLMVDLTNVSEQRAVSGYNGHPEPGLNWNEYSIGGGEYANAKMLESATLVMTDASKNSWHHVESYWKLNTVSGGKGQPDGIMQTWFDGVLVVDRRDIYYRTNANSTMQFRTFMLGPYIGDGSPGDQSMWIDDIFVATGRP